MKGVYNMKAMVLENFGEKLKLKEIKEKKVRPGTARIKVKACGVCHTDLKIIAGILPVCKEIKFPHILGHEVAGRVVELAEDVENFKVGDRVVASFYCGCGHCQYCDIWEDSLCNNLTYWAGFRDWGGYAENLVIPVRALSLIPENASYVESSVVPDAIATVYKAIKRKAIVKAGDVLMIVGAGGLGLHAVQIAKYFGAQVIILDKEQAHLDKALELGADYALKPNSKEIQKVLDNLTTDGKLDSVIDIVTLQDTFNLDIEYLKNGGKLVIVGYKPGERVNFDPLEILLKEINIMGSRNCAKPDIENSLKLISDGHVKPIIDKIVPFNEVNQIHEELHEGHIIGRAVLLFPEED